LNGAFLGDAGGVWWSRVLGLFGPLSRIDGMGRDMVVVVVVGGEEEELKLGIE